MVLMIARRAYGSSISPITDLRYRAFAARARQSYGRRQDQRSTRQPQSPPEPGSLQYVPQKVLDEIVELHLSDPGRWTPAALATRYGTPQETASACVALARLRNSGRGSSTGDGSAQSGGSSREDLRQASVAAWAKLAAPGSSGRMRGRYSSHHSERDGDGTEEFRFRLIDEVYETAKRNAAGKSEVVAEADESSDLDAQVPKVEEATSQAEGQVTEPSKTDMERFVEQLIANSGTDVKRKTSFAFIEAGVSNDKRRAIWIRDGPTGKLRAPTDEEREHLSGRKARRFVSRRKS